MSEVAEAPVAATPTTSDIIKGYLMMRDQVEQIEAECKKRVEGLKANMAKIETYFLDQFNTTGETNKSTADGTAYVTDLSFAKVTDFNLVKAYVEQTGNWQLLKKDVSKSAVEAILKETGVPPPGVSWGSKRTVNIRRK